jgi:hypothetical protein
LLPLALCFSLGDVVLAPRAVRAAPLPAPAPLSADQWRADLAFMVAEMRRRHPNLHHHVDRARFDAAVADLHARIPALQRNEIIVGLMRVAAMIGDGHTRVDPRKDPHFRFPSLPLKLYLFEDGLFVRAAEASHAALVGAEVLEIGSVPVAEAIRRTKEIISVDNEIGYKLIAPLYLAMPDILHALELSATAETATLKLRKGEQVLTVTVPAAAVDPLWPPDTDISLTTPQGWVDARSGAPPMWLEAPLDYHRLVPLPEQKALYAQVNMITGVEGQSLAQFGERIRLEAESMNAGSVILDVRLAQGGNHDLRHRFIREMVKAEDEDTRLFVLSGRGSFSATEAILVDLDRLTDAVQIGEPGSSKPDSYGDAYRTPLPHSGISIRTSIRWNQLKGQARDPWTWVDLATPYRFADYVAGRDPALGAALQFRPEPSLADRLKAAASPAVAREIVELHLTDARNRYANVERDLLVAVEMLASAKRSEIGLVVAEMAARRFPASHDTQLVLGLLSERAGRLDAAAQAGLRAVSLDPNSRQGRALLERVDRARMATNEAPRSGASADQR